MFNSLIQLHKDIFLWMHSFTEIYPEYNELIYVIAEEVDTYVVILAFIILSLLIFRSIEHTSFKRFIYLIKEGFKIIISVSISWLVTYLLKIGTALPRPFLRFPEEVSELFIYGGTESFPSGHATLFMALGVMMALYHKHFGYVFIIFAILISLARVVSGIHFPIDILVGWLIGGFISYYIYKKISF